MRSDGTMQATSSYYYNASLNGSGHWDGVTSGGTYMGGAVIWIETVNTKNGVDADAADTRLVHEYDWRDGLVLANTTHDDNVAPGVGGLWDTYYYRDGAGNLTSAYIGDSRAHRHVGQRCRGQGAPARRGRWQHRPCHRRRRTARPASPSLLKLSRCRDHVSHRSGAAADAASIADMRRDRAARR